MLKGLMLGGFLSEAATNAAEAGRARTDAVIANSRADSAEAYAGILEKAINHLREMRDGFLGVTRNVNGFRCDDAGLRAVLRETLAAIRSVAPSHPFLDKGNRDRMYGAAFEEAFQAEPDRGWAPQVGNMKALESLADAGAKILHQVAPRHALVRPDEQALVYWEAWDSEAAKVNKAISEKDPWGTWLVDYASKIEQAADKSYLARKFNKNTRPASMKKA